MKTKTSFNNAMRDHGCLCKGCGKRYPGCHDRRGDYGAWKAEHERALENEKAQMRKYETMSDAHIRRIWKQKRYSSRVGYAGKKSFE